MTGIPAPKPVNTCTRISGIPWTAGRYRARPCPKRFLNGETYFFNINDDFTHIVFGGINFACDLAAPEGSRIRIDGFSNGRAFEEDRVYLAAVNIYILGNEHCGLRKFSAADALWAQEDGESIQDLIGEYIREQCGTDGALTIAPFT